jgi:phage terminase large subunit-like protein
MSIKKQAKTIPFDQFAYAMRFPRPSDGELRPFGESAAPSQREVIARLAPLLMAVAKGEKPPKRGVWWEAAKGNGKDFLISLSLLYLAATAQKPLEIELGAADRDQADGMRGSANDWLHANPGLKQLVEVQNYRILGTKNKVEIDVLAADATGGAHGSRPSVLVLNEATHIAKWQFAQDLLDNADKIPKCLILICTNAGFIHSEAWKLREIYRNSDRWEFIQHCEPAPWTNPADIEEAKARNSPTRFARLWGGVWSSGAGDAIEEEDVLACIRAESGPHLERRPGWQYLSGLDIGIKRDHSSLVTLGRPPRSTVPVLVNVRSWAPIRLADGKRKDIDLDEVELAVWQEHQRFGLKSCRFDPHQCGQMSQRLSKRGVPMVEVPFVGANLNLMASCLVQTFRERGVQLYDDPRLIKDLLRLTIIEKSYGMRLESTRDADGHADRATAFALALPGIKSLPMQSGQWDGPINVAPTSRLNSQSPGRAHGQVPYSDGRQRSYPGGSSLGISGGRYGW